MPPPVRERQVRLLADSRGADPRARLSQASNRADFLLRLSRTVSSVQHPSRAMEGLVALIVEEMVGFAQLTLRSGVHELVCGAVQGCELRLADGLRVPDAAPTVDEAMRQGVSQHLPLPRSRSQRDEAIASLVSIPELREELDALRSESVLLLPLSARGRTFGLLALARSEGLGFDEGAQPFLDDLTQRISVVVDATLVVAESRHVASVLRRSLLPSRAPDVAHLEVASFFRVAHEHEEVGGDFYDLHGPDDDLLVLIGDVSGKGVEAAIHAKRIRNAVRTAGLVRRDPGWVLGLVNQVMVTETDASPDVIATALCARLRVDDGRLRVDLASAGHPPALVLRAEGPLEVAPGGGVALAVEPDQAYDETVLHLGPRDALVLYTDGVTEARGADELFGEERLRTELRELGGMLPSAVVERAAMAVSHHLGERDHDDIALVVLQYRPDGP